MALLFQGISMAKKMYMIDIRYFAQENLNYRRKNCIKIHMDAVVI